MCPVAKPNRRRRKPASKRARVAERGWWGEGPPPWKRWPGATIEINAKWCAKRARWESLDGVYYFDQAAADKVVEFFPTFLKHYKGEFDGQPFTLLDYQRELVVKPLFGWKRASDGLRRFRKAFLFVPKGSGKTPLGAGLGLFLMLCDGEAGAEVYAAAADRDQARILFDTAKVMVESDATLSEIAKPYKNVIEAKRFNAYYRVLSAEAPTKHGFNVHGLLIDELHAQPNRDLYETLDRGTVKRRQPITFLMSTAGDDDESVCYEEYEYAKRVISGSVPDPTYLPIVFELPEKADWRDEGEWWKCNPGLGVTVKLDALRAASFEAQAEPRKRNAFLQLHGNRWTSGAVAWIPAERWDACPLLADAENADLVKRLPELQVAAGLDLAQKHDLTAFVLVFRVPLVKAVTADVVVADVITGALVTQSMSLNYRIVVIPHFWIPEDTAAEHEQQDRIPYNLYREKGWITYTEGPVIDNDQIFRDITTKIAPRYPLLKQGRLGYDPGFATDLAVKLRGAGFNVADVPQNYQYLSEASQIFESLVKAKRVVHDGNRLMRWNVENVMVKQDDAGRIRPVKPKKGRSTKRIDGVVGAVMGLGGVMAPEAPPSTRTMYEDRAPVLLEGEEDWRPEPAAEDAFAKRQRQQDAAAERFRKAMEDARE